MKWSLWSDEDRWLLPRALGFGYSVNLKYAAKRLGWIRPGTSTAAAEPPSQGPGTRAPETRQERLCRQADESKYEVKP